LRKLHLDMLLARTQ